MMYFLLPNQSVFMLAVPYEGLLEPAFTTREEAEKYWADEIEIGHASKMSKMGVVEVKVVDSSKEDSQ